MSEEREPNGALLPVDLGFELLRQVHPNHRDEDWVTPLVFKPNSSDGGLLSTQIKEDPVTDRHGLKPSQAYVLYSEDPPAGHGLKSSGVIAVSTKGAELAGTPAYADPIEGDEFHACLDWREKSLESKEERSLVRGVLLADAERLGRWQWGPVEPND